MRTLDESFLSALKDGCLADLTATVRSDATLCLELRGDRVNVYYRGGSLMELRQGRQPEGEYSVSFDTNYFAAGEEIELPNRTIRNRDDLARWLASWPGIKRAMDGWLWQNRANAEKEFQQLVARDNNFGSVARDTDYYVCDLEYQSGQGRFDMIAVHWPSESAVRKHARDRRLVFVEVKYGDSALANLHAHVRDVNDFAADPHRLGELQAGHGPCVQPEAGVETHQMRQEAPDLQWRAAARSPDLREPRSTEIDPLQAAPFSAREPARGRWHRHRVIPRIRPV